MRALYLACVGGGGPVNLVLVGHTNCEMAAPVELVSPSAVFCDSYRSLVDEFVERSENLVPFVLAFQHTDFDEFLAQLAECSRGRGLAVGFVPHSTYWLIRDNRDVVGVSNIRHSLTPALRRERGNIGYGIRPSYRGQGFGVEILRRSLCEAKSFGLSSVLLTCGKANIASAKTIIRNGGVLESEEYLSERGEVVQRYVIGVVSHGVA